MRVYKATYTDRSSKKRKTTKWYCDFSDHNQLRHKIPKAAMMDEQNYAGAKHRSKIKQFRTAGCNRIQEED